MWPNKQYKKRGSLPIYSLSNTTVMKVITTSTGCPSLRAGAVPLPSLRHRVHIEWQWSLSGVHSIMMVKLTLAASTILTITYKVTVYAPAERADTLPPYPPFHLYSCVVDVKHRPNHPSPLPTRTEITTCSHQTLLSLWFCMCYPRFSPHEFYFA